MSSYNLLPHITLAFWASNTKKSNRQKKSWVIESTAVHSDIGILGGYGYMWWVALNGEHFPFLKLPDGTFSARGTGEQVILIIPESNVVIVHRTNVLKPRERYMHVTEFAKILKRILEAKVEK